MDLNATLHLARRFRDHVCAELKRLETDARTKFSADTPELGTIFVNAAARIADIDSTLDEFVKHVNDSPTSGERKANNISMLVGGAISQIKTCYDTTAGKVYGLFNEHEVDDTDWISELAKAMDQYYAGVKNGDVVG